MSDQNDKGSGSNGSGKLRPDDWETRHKLGEKRAGKVALPPGVQTPEQGCITCLVGILIIGLSLAFWVYIYWRYNPEFHPEMSGAAPTPKASTPKRKP